MRNISNLEEVAAASGFPPDLFGICHMDAPRWGWCVILRSQGSRQSAPEAATDRDIDRLDYPSFLWLVCS